MERTRGEAELCSKDHERHVVFLLNSAFPYQTGGRETWLANVTSRLAARGFPLTVLTLMPKRAQTKTRFDLPASIELRQAATLHRYRSVAWLMRSYGSLLGMWYYTWQLYRELKGLHKRYGGLTVVCLDTVLASTAAVRLRRRLARSTKLVVSCRGFAADELSRRFPPAAPMFRWLERRSLTAADEVWTNGLDTQEYYAARGYNPIMIGNGADVERFSSLRPGRPPRHPGDCFQILSVATLRPVKGVDALIRAAGRLAHTANQQFEVAFAGKGDAAPYAALAAKLGIGDRVRFLGEREDVPELMARADIVACLSGGGGMSMATLEAMAAGTPIVAWDSPVYRQMLTHDQTGFLVPTGDEEALARALEEAMADPGKLQRLAERARIEVRNYDWAVVTQRVVARLEAFA